MSKQVRHVSEIKDSEWDKVRRIVERIEKANKTDIVFQYENDIVRAIKNIFLIEKTDSDDTPNP